MEPAAAPHHLARHRRIADRRDRHRFPQQVPVVIYKLNLVSLAAAGGYWIDRALFPYGRPDGYLLRDWRCGPCIGTHRVDYPIADGYHHLFMVATIRRAVITAAVIVAVALGL
ncbi:putative holin [Achromobacter denitrificans]